MLVEDLKEAQQVTLCRFSSSASAHFGDDQLQQLLQDPNIEAVIIVLPVQVMLKVTDCCYVSAPRAS